MVEADTIVVGGGSAGAVIASRLSEDRWRRVLLVEAGRDIEPGTTAVDIQNTFPASYFNRDYFWPGAAASLRANEEPVPFPQPRVMGGGSSVGGMIALRGLPSDYDEWRRMGALGWAWNDVLPTFQRMTRDLDEPPSRRHGGPNIVRRIERERWPLYMRRLEQAITEQGGSSHKNIYDSAEDGFFATPLSQDTSRVTSARAYLTTDVRARSNLTIMPDTRVLRLVFEDKRVTGIVAEQGGEIKRIMAPQVVVSAGAVNSPVLLLRSGIGSADDLRKLGIDIVADSAGVGRNYQNHPQLHYAMTLKHYSQLAPDWQHYIIASLRFSSGIEGGSKGDLFHYYTGRISHKPFGRRMALVAAALYSPLSRGLIRLRSQDPNVAPDIQQHLLSDPRDARRMVIAARHAMDLLFDPSVRDCFEEIYIMPRRAPLGLINGSGLSGVVKSIGARAVLAAPSGIRRRVIGAAIRSGRLVATDVDRHPVSDEDILDGAGAMFHPSSTCAMVASDDPMAVVDPRCRVYGVEGVHVADASVMPRIVNANTNIPTIMIAERVSELIRATK